MIRLPVNPEKLPVAREAENGDYNVLGIGPIMVPRTPNQREVTVSSFFPGRLFSGVLTSGAFQPPEFYINFFESAMHDRVPILYTPVRYYENGERNPMYRKHQSESAKKKIAAVHIGLKHSEEAKAQMSKSHTGKHFSESHKRALSESMKRAKAGFRWMTNGEQSRSVSPQTAEELLAAGWWYGRTTNKHPPKKE